MWPFLLHNWFNYSYCRTPSTQRHLKNEPESTKDLNFPLYFFPSPCILPFFRSSDDNIFKSAGFELNCPLRQIFDPPYTFTLSKCIFCSQQLHWRSVEKLLADKESNRNFQLWLEMCWWLVTAQVLPASCSGFYKNKQKTHFSCYAMCGLSFYWKFYSILSFF